jgi:uncharacterized membrane protein
MARRNIGLAIVFLWFLIGGIAHFVFTEAEMRIVPPYIPWPWAAVIVSGAFELLGAAGILWRPTRRLAGLGLMALTVAVTPAHIFMLQQPEFSRCRSGHFGRGYRSRVGYCGCSGGLPRRRIGGDRHPLRHCRHHPAGQFPRHGEANRKWVFRTIVTGHSGDRDRYPGARVI